MVNLVVGVANNFMLLELLVELFSGVEFGEFDLGLERVSNTRLIILDA